MILMKLVNSLYTYGFNDRKKKKVLDKLGSNKKLSKSICVVTYPLFGDGLVEIYNYKHLLSKCYDKLRADIVVLGVASDRANADILVTDMIQDVYDSDVDFNIKNYFGI